MWLGPAPGGAGSLVLAGKVEDPAGVVLGDLAGNVVRQESERFFQHFPRDQVRVYFYEEFRANPRVTLADLFGFLKVDPSFQPNFSQRFLEPSVPQFVAAAYLLKRLGVWQGVRRWSPPPIRRVLKSAAVRKRSALVMDAEDRRYLRRYYRDDIGKLAALLDRDLRMWLE